MRIVVLGGGFGGVATVRPLERVLRRRTDVEITLVSRENFFVLTPLLFKACSGRLELATLRAAHPRRTKVTFPLAWERSLLPVRRSESRASMSSILRTGG